MDQNRALALFINNLCKNKNTKKINKDILMLLKTIIVGASGYVGLELIKILNKHDNIKICNLYVSSQSEDKNKDIATLHGSLYDVFNMKLESLDNVSLIAKNCDVVFLATDHKVSHDLAPIFYKHNCHVFDLSGAFRVKDIDSYKKYYAFTHEHKDLLDKAIYGLCEFADTNALKESRLISLPGCYPTASQLALKPLVQEQVLDNNFKVIINAISGVTGAGRKASLTNSFCEISTQAYNIFTHRHQFEIEDKLQTKVIFNPHLGNFKRGILATISAKLNANYTKDDIKEIFTNYYGKSKFVRLKDTMPKIMDVENLPFCDLSFCIDDGYIVIGSAIDNLLKGAASQAVQALNLHFNFNEDKAII